MVQRMSLLLAQSGNRSELRVVASRKNARWLFLRCDLARRLRRHRFLPPWSVEESDARFSE
jgi:hypothetical protein